MGVALFEALTGAAPQNLKPLMQTRSGEPVPDAMSSLLQRCLALDPAQRPASAAQVRDALLGISGAPVAPRPSTDSLEAAAGVGKSKRSRNLLVAVVLLGVVGVTAYSQRPTDESVLADPAPKRVVTPTPTPTPKTTEPVVAPVVVGPSTSLGVSGKKPKQPKIAPTPVNPFAGRAETLRRRYDGLVSRFGTSQITSLEKAAVAQALDDYRLDRQSDLAESLTSAEAALDAADRRLSR